MSRLLLFLGALGILLSTGFSASNASASASNRAGVFNPKVFQLSNGMQGIVIERPGIPAAIHMVWYRAGAADELLGKSGVAHILEHMMFRGTENLEDGEFSEKIARMGGEDNAFTSWDYTAYFQMITPEFLPQVMLLEANRMQHLELSQDAFTPELGVVLEERNQRTDNNPAALLGERLYAALYLNQPYGTPIIGWREDIEGLTLADLKTFYETYYTPQNAILVVAGDVKVSDVQRLAEEIYGDIPAKPAPIRAMPKEPPLLTPVHLTLEDAKIRQPQLTRLYRAPSYGTGPVEETLALQVLAEILSSGEVGEFYKHFVLDQKLASSARVSYTPYRRGLSAISFSLTPRPDVSLESLESALDAYMAALIENPVFSEQRVNQAILRLKSDAVYAQDSLRTGAFILGQAAAMGIDLDIVEAWPEALSQITPTEVAKAISTILDQPAHVTGMLKSPESLESKETNQ